MTVVAVIGASRDRAKFGNRAVRHLRAEGYAVVPINPHEATIEGLAAYRSLRDVPGPIDIATIYLPPERAARVLRDVAARRIPEVWINPGADTPEVLEQARALGIEPIQACTLLGLRAPRSTAGAG